MESLFTLRLRKLGFALRHPRLWRALAHGIAPTMEHGPVLRDLRPDLILDVGANRGQFALLCQTILREATLVSFEPLPKEAAVYRAIMGGRRGVTLHECALGETPGTATIHLSGRADSSSLLPIGDLQEKLFPSTAEVGTLEVRVARLDDFETAWGSSRRALLKIDVQGFELSVLKGATRALEHCAYVYCECSEVPLYVGQALVGEIRTFLESHGFVVKGRFNESRSNGTLVQADYLFEAASQ